MQTPCTLKPLWTKNTPKPGEPEASGRKFRVSDEYHSDDKKELAPFQLEANSFHITRSWKKPELSLMWWCGFFTFLVKSTMRWRNGRPGGTNLHAKLRVPMSHWSSLRVQERFPWNCSMISCNLAILSGGCLACILIVSKTIPINSITCEGPCVLPWAIGMFKVWKRDNMFVRLCWQRLLWGGKTAGGSIKRK